MQEFCERLDKLFESVPLSYKLGWDMIYLFHEYNDRIAWITYCPDDLDECLPYSIYEENGVILRHDSWERYDKISITYENSITIIMEQSHGCPYFKIKNGLHTIAKTQCFSYEETSDRYLADLMPKSSTKSARKSNSN